MTLGANHGSFSVVASSIVGAEGHVIAVEPQPHLSALLQRSLEIGKSPYKVHQLALGDRSGDVSLYIPKDTSGAAGVYGGHSATHSHRTLSVPLRRFDEAVHWQQCPGQIVVKLDVEGNEIPFLRGAQEMIEERRPILIVEINPKTLEASGFSGDQLRKALLNFGYETYSSSKKSEEKDPLSELPTSDQRNVVVWT